MRRGATVYVALLSDEDLGTDADDSAVPTAEPTAEREEKDLLIFVERARRHEERSLLLALGEFARIRIEPEEGGGDGELEVGLILPACGQKAAMTSSLAAEGGEGFLRPAPRRGAERVGFFPGVKVF